MFRDQVSGFKKSIAIGVDNLILLYEKDIDLIREQNEVLKDRVERRDRVIAEKDQKLVDYGRLLMHEKSRFVDETKNDTKEEKFINVATTTVSDILLRKLSSRGRAEANAMKVAAKLLAKKSANNRVPQRINSLLEFTDAEESEDKEEKGGKAYEMNEKTARCSPLDPEQRDRLLRAIALLPRIWMLSGDCTTTYPSLERSWECVETIMAMPHRKESFSSSWEGLKNSLRINHNAFGESGSFYVKYMQKRGKWA